MMPARKRPWYMRLLFWQLPPREPKPTPRQRANTLKELDAEAEWREVRARYDEAFQRFNHQLEEVRKRPGRRRGRRHNDL